MVKEYFNENYNDVDFNHCSKMETAEKFKDLLFFMYLKKRKN